MTNLSRFDGLTSMEPIGSAVLPKLRLARYWKGFDRGTSNGFLLNSRTWTATGKPDCAYNAAIRYPFSRLTQEDRDRGPAILVDLGRQKCGSMPLLPLSAARIRRFWSAPSACVRRHRYQPDPLVFRESRRAAGSATAQETVLGILSLDDRPGGPSLSLVTNDHSGDLSIGWNCAFGLSSRSRT
jgi:hypothetical protein